MINKDCLVILQSIFHYDNRLIRRVIASVKDGFNNLDADAFFKKVTGPSDFCFDKKTEVFLRSKAFTPSKIAWAKKALRAIQKASKENLDIGLLSFENPLFPSKRLSVLGEDEPVLLFYRGDPKALVFPSVAIVGTRDPDDEYIKHAKYLAYSFAKNGFTIVSGLAKGCDAAAHEGCLEAEGITIGILANGLDRIYPKENTVLANRICLQDGCLISEYPPYSRIEKWFFPKRDKLQAALSDGLIVIETKTTGGTMIATDFSQKLGHPLFAIADNENNPKATGNRFLVENHLAKPISMERLENKEINELAQDIKENMTLKKTEQLFLF